MCQQMGCRCANRRRRCPSRSHARVFQLQRTLLYSTLRCPAASPIVPQPAHPAVLCSAVQCSAVLDRDRALQLQPGARRRHWDISQSFEPARAVRFVRSSSTSSPLHPIFVRTVTEVLDAVAAPSPLAPANTPLPPGFTSISIQLPCSKLHTFSIRSHFSLPLPLSPPPTSPLIFSTPASQ
ncbi:hypothetical protein BDZ91DRAFT_514978 [Kalaharituber pfeilii]|nr:hypothetical protein BDZ91DRAFT_514978 [Kalaharituber pfeilii]